MKKVYLLFTIAFSFFLFNTLQAASSLDTKISLRTKNQTLESIFDSISSQSGIQFSYSPSVINVAQLMSVDVQNKTAKDVIEKILGNKYEYKLRRKHVVIKKQILQSAESQNIKSNKEDYLYIINQAEVKKLCYSDSGTVLGDCPIITNTQKNEVMKKQLAMLMLAAATTSAQAQETSTKEQLANAGKSLADLVVEVANSTVEAVKIAADGIGKQVSKVTTTENSVDSSSSTQGAIAVVIPDDDEGNIMLVAQSNAEETSMQSALKTEANQQSKFADYKEVSIDSSHPFLITLFYPFSFPDTRAHRYTYNVSLNVLAGYNGGVRGLELGGVVNANRHTMSGFQGAGVVNASLGSVTGVQMAGVVNVAAKDTASVQLAGIVNAAQNARFQGAGVVNSAYGNGQAQIAGIANVSVKGNSSLQIAGVANTANTANVQLAGIANAAKQADVQISGISNASAGNNSTQISAIANVADTTNFQLGLVNISRKTGTQIGLINVCDTASGVMIGLVNVARKNALRELEVSNSISSINVAYRMGTRKFYSFLEISYGYDNELWMKGLGIGTQLDFPKNWGMNIEALFQNVSVDFFKSDSFNGLSQLRVVGYKRFAKHFAVFAGPALYIYNSDLKGDKPLDFKAPYTIYSQTSGNTLTEIWVGTSVGIRF